MLRKRGKNPSPLALSLCLAVCLVFVAPILSHASCLCDLEVDEGASSAALSIPGISTTYRAADVVVRDVAVPAVETRSQKLREDKKEEKKEAGVKVSYPRVIAGYARYESVSLPGLDIDGYGLSAGLAWDVDDASYGFVIPYDNSDVSGVDINRYGVVGFYQHNRPVAEDWNLALTANLTYMYMDLDAISVSVYGVGPTVSMTYDDGGSFVPSLALSYQYSTDDTDSANNYQHLVKAGANFGFRIGEDAAINLFGIWNWDVSDYMEGAATETSGDVGIEAQYYMSDVFSLSGGYKAVVGVDDFDSYTIYLGALLRF